MSHLSWTKGMVFLTAFSRGVYGEVSKYFTSKLQFSKMNASRVLLRDADVKPNHSTQDIGIEII